MKKSLKVVVYFSKGGITNDVGNRKHERFTLRDLPL